MTGLMIRSLGLGLTLALSACGGPAIVPPATLTPGEESCRSCRMAISTTRTAAQIVAPHEEALFFDDIGCLRDYLREHRTMPDRAAAYVADHRTGNWVPARSAVYARVEDRDTPMGSHLLAFADSSSRDRDEAARRGQPLDPDELFDGLHVPDGAP